MSRLVARGLRVVRAGRAILDGVELDLEGGALVGVIGANGAGKSTLLSVLAGLLKPEAGEVALDGAALAAIPARMLARRRAYLPQNPRAEWPIPVERLVALGLTPHLPTFGGLPSELSARVGRAVEAFDLAERRDQPVTTLSGGELTRAMLARALVGDPDVLIVDEPVAGLDPRHALETMARLTALARQGKLVVASIHDLTLAVRHADRIVALHRGRVAADGPTEDVLTPELLRRVFDVEGAVIAGDGGPFVDVSSAPP